MRNKRHKYPFTFVIEVRNSFNAVYILQATDIINFQEFSASCVLLIKVFRQYINTLNEVRSPDHMTPLPRMFRERRNRRSHQSRGWTRNRDL